MAAEDSGGSLQDPEDAAEEEDDVLRLRKMVHQREPSRSSVHGDQRPGHGAAEEEENPRI